MRFQKHINEATGKTSLLEIVQVLYDKCLPYIKDMRKTKYAADLFSGRHDNRDYFIKPVRKDRTPTDMNQDLTIDIDREFRSRFGWEPRSNALFVTGSHNQASYYGSYVFSIFPAGRYKFLYSPNIKDMYSEFEDGDVENWYKGDFEVSEWELDQEADYIRAEIEERWEDDNPRPEEDDFYDEDEEDTDWDEYDRETQRWEDKRDRAVDYEVDMHLEDFKQNLEASMEDRARMEVEDLVRRYTDKDLVKGIKANVEIMVNAKEYVAVDSTIYYDYLEDFIQWYDWRKRPTVETMRAYLNKRSRVFKGTEINFGHG